MARYAIHRTDLGTATARPVRGVIEVSDLPAADVATRLADQLALLAVKRGGDPDPGDGGLHGSRQRCLDL